MSDDPYKAPDETKNMRSFSSKRFRWGLLAAFLLVAGLAVYRMGFSTAQPFVTPKCCDCSRGKERKSITNTQAG